LVTDPNLTWQAVVAQCGNACRSIDIFDEGAFKRSDVERRVGTPFIGRSIRWEGVVVEVKGKGKTIKGLGIKMPIVEVALPDSKTFVGDWLFLRFGRTQLPSPSYLGKTVVFSGRFPPHDVFPNLTFSPDREQQKVFLGLMLEDGRLIALS
jgi:hypothetical protein